MSTASLSKKQRRRRRLRDIFAEHLRVNNLAARTIEAYINAVIMFCRFHAGLHPLHVTTNHIRAFLFHCKEERGFAPRYYNQVLYGLKAFYTTFMPDVPIMDQFRRHKTNRHHVKILTRPEIEKMIRVTDNIKHRAMIELLYSTGIRLCECTAIGFGDIDRTQMLITIRAGKGRKDRYVPLSQRCLKTLEQYCRERKPHNYLIPGQDGKRRIAPNTIEHAVRKAAKRAGITKKVSPHILRHSFATHMLETDGRLPVLQAILGHENIKTTARYLHVCPAMVKTVTSPLDVAVQKFAAPKKGGYHG